MDLKVVGRTNHHECYVASLARKFVIDEFLIIEDDVNKNPIGVVVETFEYSHISPDTFDRASNIYIDLTRLEGYKEGKPVYLARVRTLFELMMPVKSSARVRLPKFQEVQKYLTLNSPKEGFVLGSIRGSQSIYDSLPQHLKNIAPLYQEDAGILPQDGVPYIFSHYGLKQFPHILLSGGSGSGKTHGLRVLCEEIMAKRLPAICFDVHYEMDFSEKMPGLPEGLKADYRNDYKTFVIGKDVGIDFTELTADDLCTVLEYSGALSEPMRNTVKAIHEAGDSVITFQTRLERLIKAFEEMEKPPREQEQLDGQTVMLYEKLKNGIAGLSTLVAIMWRLQAVINEGIFKCDVNGVQAALFQRKLAVIRGNQRLLNILAGYMLKKFYRARRYYKDSRQKIKDGVMSSNGIEPFPPFFIIMDEVHNFAPRGNFLSPTKSILREINKEGRKYGVFEIFATQSPSCLDEEIMSSISTKIIFRTVKSDDIETIKNETDISESEIKRLPYLSSGCAFISSAMNGRTVSVQFRSGFTVSPHTLHPFDELEEYNQDEKLKEVLKELLPLYVSKLPLVHGTINKALKRLVTQEEIWQALEKMVNSKEIEKQKSPFGDVYCLTSHNF